MDIKDKIEEIVNKVKGDPKLMEKFQSDPAAAIKDITGIDIPADQIKPVIDGVKAKIGVDNVSGLLGGILGKK